MNIQRRQAEYIKFSILIALEDGTSQSFGDLVDRVKFLLNKPGQGQHDQFYYNVSVVIGQWCRDEKGYVEDSAINSDLPTGHWKITPKGEEFRNILRQLLS
ncbi:MAG: hypothetical protein OXU36_23415 [Candidatus Poribacteria bacterium]|nr:hypothetical protein [Candidatus Poribacteria bacterium]